ncbi:MAG: DNA replication/repair protein RecF [Dehalococcoidia bacterium]|nr:DNA replication/repair protein RecF [Dehalococcoidia bacterium]
MYIEHLSLINFRNYERLELELPSHLMVLQGDNAQGKTNLLEAIYLLATARSHRTATERELINWSAPREGLGIARLLAQVQKRGGNIRVEIAVMAAYPSPEEVATAEPSGATHVQKRIRINGIPRRASDLVGQINVVLFSSQDIDLIGGAPSLRRRYLDLTNSQVNSRYLRALQRYNKVLLQRNHLLRLIGERRAAADQLDFWDRELVGNGSYLINERQLMVAELNEFALPIHHQLTAEREKLGITYLPSVSVMEFQDRLREVREKEVALGMSLVGPHRDDLAFLVNDVDMNVYGSRGQQRTIALSLKLAEARFMHTRVDDHPILLLDDVLSELDAARRHHLLGSIASYQQLVITTTDLDRFDSAFLAEAALFQVSEGRVRPL